MATTAQQKLDRMYELAKKVLADAEALHASHSRKNTEVTELERIEAHAESCGQLRVARRMLAILEDGHDVVVERVAKDGRVIVRSAT